MGCGKRISELRKKKKMTQGKLAKELYVTDKTISSWEQERTEPSLEALIKLSSVLECSLDYLIHGSHYNTTQKIEIKIEITEKEYKYLDSILKSKTQLLYNSNQHDIYYQPTYNKFFKGENTIQWLRIRNYGNKNILTYKKWHNNIIQEAYKVEIDNYENLDKIFGILDLEKVVIVDKKRKAYSFNKYQISLDVVQKLGYFIEIKTNQENDEKEEYNKLLSLLKNLYLESDRVIFEKYPYLLINKR